MKKSILILFVSTIIISCQQKSELERNSEAKNDKKILMTSSNADIALKFINDYVKNCNKINNTTEIVEWANSNGNATQKFKNELTRIITEAEAADPELGLDFDPIFDAQDYPEEGFKLESLDSKSGYLVVTGKEWKEFRLKMKMIEMNGQWLVDGCGIINIPKEKQIER